MFVGLAAKVILFFPSLPGRRFIFTCHPRSLAEKILFYAFIDNRKLTCTRSKVDVLFVLVLFSFCYTRTLAFHLNSVHVLERVLTSDLKIPCMMLGDSR